MAIVEARLRVAVVLDGIVQPRWIEHALHLIAGGGHGEIVAALVGSAAAGASPSRRHTLYRLYTRLDRQIFQREPDPAEPRDVSPLLGQAVVMPEADDAANRTALDAADIDVILCFTAPERARAHRLVDAARLGVWHFPDLVTFDGIELPVGFAATVAGRDVVTTTLNDLRTDGTPGQARYTAVSAVNRYSPHYTDRRVKWKMAAFPARALEALAKRGDTPDTPPAHAMQARTPSKSIPGNIRMAGIAARFGWRLAAHAVRSALYRSEWGLAWRAEPDGPDFKRNEQGTYASIENPPDRFWADPFPVQDGDATWLFVEEFPHGANHAHLAVMELGRNGRVGPATTVLAQPYHLSYPYVFRWNDAWYMVPETLANRTVDLYRSTRFPFEWTHEQTLLHDVAAVDATLFEHDGQWWMFTTIAPFGGSENDELHIFMADTPLGPWRPHPWNPQTSDVRGSRPAGRIFLQDGAWHRPAQDCARRYGFAMTIQRIVTLTGDRYVEEAVGRIAPNWAPGLLGTHTLNHANGLTVVDGDRWRPRFRLPFRR